MEKDTDLAWAAGFFEGEGGIYTNRQRRNGRVYPTRVLVVAQSDRAPLERFQRIMGGSIYKVGPNAVSKKQRYKLQIGGREAVAAAEAKLAPYLT